MNLTNHQKIGTHFKKENIFIATLSATPKNEQWRLPDETYRLLKSCEGVSIEEQHDVFYKDGDKYVCFFDEGPKVVVGDNSDGMGVMSNIVPVWEYFAEDELFEVMVNDSFMAIGYTNMMALARYNVDYNLRKIKP